MVITIDGTAGSGKSSVARLLAEKLNFVHFNAGLLYRAITAHVISNKIDINSFDFTTLSMHVELKNNQQFVFVNNIDYTNQLKNKDVSLFVATVSTNECVQQICQKCIREFCNSNNVVIDGRGLGNSTLPNADYKFYVDCAIEDRARRRQLEMKTNISLEEMIQQLHVRDNLDKTRTFAPLVIADGAIQIDNTNLNIEQTVQEMLKFIKHA